MFVKLDIIPFSQKLKEKRNIFTILYKEMIVAHHLNCRRIGP